MATDWVLPKLPCKLPPPRFDHDVDPESVGLTFENRLANLSRDDFAEDAIWRDILAYTGTFRTFYGSINIFPIWTKLTSKNGMTNVRLEKGLARVSRIGDLTGWVEVWYSFETTGNPETTCKAILSFVLDENGKWRIWLIRTMLYQLKNSPHVDHLEPTTDHKGTNGVSDGLAEIDTHFDCVVVGGGQVGLSMAGRLKALNISYVVLEKNENVGDNWKLRYDAVKLHTTRRTAYLPFDATFPCDQYNQYLSKDDLAEGYARWAKKYDINIWLGTALHSGEWVADKKQWKLTVQGKQHSGTITARHVVMGTGAGGQIPKWPKYPGAEQFGGEILHSSQFKSAAPWKGKAGIVLGTANTGHDIAEDMVHSGCSSVTMVQRSPTYVFSTKYWSRLELATYDEQIPMEIADIGFQTNPTALGRLLGNFALHSSIKADSEIYDALERRGFRLDRYGDVIYNVMERFGGHYMDVGAVEKIINGSIKVKSDAVPVRYSSKGLVFSDGTEIDADVVVMATGFEANTRGLVQQIFGPEISDQIEDFWGIDCEGEIKGNFKPSGHPHFWMGGGGTGHARFLSRFVALHIRADLDGTPLEVYQDGKYQHKQS